MLSHEDRQATENESVKALNVIAVSVLGKTFSRNIKQATASKLIQSNISIRRRRIRNVMAFIHEGSCDCAKSELDLFSLPPTHTIVSRADCLSSTGLSLV